MAGASNPTGNRGCLFALLGSGTAPKAIGSGLPRLETSRVHPADRAAYAKAQKAADDAMATFTGAGGDGIAAADLAERLGAVVEVLHRLVGELRGAREFLAANDPDKLARERADLEMRRLGATAAEILALRTANDALASRARLADEVKGEVGALEARLVAAGHELEAFRGRIARGSRDDLDHELGAYLKSAELALEAHERTRRELASLR